MDFEAYKVAVRVSMTENVTAGLLAISKKFSSTNKDAEKFQQTMEKIGKMTLVGGVLVGIGLGITKGLDATIKAANDLVKAQNDFKTLNLSVQDNALVNSTAQLNTHQVLGSTIAGNIRLIQDLHTAFGDLHHAISVAPEFTKYETVLKMSLGQHAADGAVNAMAKSLEHRGGKVLTDHEEFKSELAMATQVQLATKNRVRAQDFLLASQTGGMAYSMLSKEYLYGKFAGLMTMMQSGDRAGTMLMTTFSSLIGGHMDNKAKGFLASLGLSEEGVSKERMKIIANAMKGMSKEQKSIYMQSLGGEKLLSGGLTSGFSDMFMHHPDQFVDAMVARIKGKYGKNLSDEQISKIISANFNRKTGDFLSMQYKNRAKLEKDANVFQHAMNYNQAYDLYLNSPDGASAALSAAWTNVKAVLGLQLIPTLTKVTLGFAQFMDKVSAFAENNPWATKIAMYSATALAGLTLLSGGILLLGATITAARLVGSLGVVSSFATLLGGPVVWALVAAAGAGALVYKNWDKIKPAAEQMGKEFAGIMSVIGERIKQAGTHASDWISGWGIWSSLAGFGNKLESGFNSIFDTIISYMNKIPGVDLLTTQQEKVKSQGLNLLNDLNMITGGPKLPATVKYDKKTYSGNVADAYASQGNAAPLSAAGMAAGMASASGRTTVAVPGKQSQTVQVNSTVNLDGKKVGEAVTMHQTKEASKAPSTTSAFDSSNLMIYPGQVSKMSTN
jgi:hypothetical protein